MASFFNDNCKKLLNAVGEVLIVFDSAGYIIEVNDRACEILNDDRDSLLEKNILNFVLEEDEGLIKPLFDENFDENNKEFQLILSPNSGEKYPSEVFIKKLELKGKVVFLMTARSIIRCKKMRQELNAQLDREKILKMIASKLSGKYYDDLDQVLKCISEDSESVLKIDFVEVILLDRSLNLFKKKSSKEELSFIKTDKEKTFNLEESFPWLKIFLEKGSTLLINKGLDSLPEEAFLEKKRFKECGFKKICCSPIYFNNALRGVLLFASIDESKTWTSLDINYIEMLSDIASSSFLGHYTLQHYKETLLKLEEALNKMVVAFGLTMEEKDPYTAGHQFRVAELAKAIAQKMELEETLVEQIYLGALIHDIGKIYVPSEILSSPRALLKEEKALIKRHPEVGFNILKEIPLSEALKKTVYQHHERLDGSGYPQKLKEKDIFIGAQIVAVADVYEAMVSHRPYRPGLPKEVAIKELQSGAGKIYNAQAVEACLSLIEEGFQFPQARGTFFFKEN